MASARPRRGASSALLLRGTSSAVRPSRVSQASVALGNLVARRRCGLARSSSRVTPVWAQSDRRQAPKPRSASSSRSMSISSRVSEPTMPKDATPAAT